MDKTNNNIHNNRPRRAVAIGNGANSERISV